MMESLCENGDRKLNIIVIGETNVGKSSLIRQFIDEEFYEDEKPTVAAETRQKLFTIDGENICVEIMDVSGLHDYQSPVSMIFRNFNCSNENRFGLILVYDVTNIKSFDNLTKWFEDLEVTDQKNIIKTVIGNKIDLRDKIVISINRGEGFARRFNADFYETSAANDLNVKIAFESLVRKLIDDEKEKKIKKTCCCQ